MRRREKEVKKYPPTTRPTGSGMQNYAEKDIYGLQNRPVHQDIREQLRVALQELQHNRLTSDLEVQKRILLEQQLKNAKQQNDQQKVQNEELRKQISKIAKKYNKIKERKECQKCKGQDDILSQLQRQRDIYANDRKMMQDEIKILKNQLQSTETSQERDRLIVLTDSLYKELQLANKKLEQQARVIHFLNQKLSHFEMENLQIMKKIQMIESRFSDMEIDTIYNKKRMCQNCSVKNKSKNDDNYSNISRSRQRRNGSIQNIKKTERDQYGSELERYQP